MPRPTHPSKSLRRLHAAFLRILPKIVLHAEYSFRYVKCPQTRDDFVAESVALTWKWFLRLVEQAKDPTDFPTVLASFAVRAVKSGRRLCRQESPKDALSPTAHRRRGFVLTKLPDFSTESTNPLQEALIDNSQSPVPEQVAFRIDVPRWLAQRPERNREISVDLALGHKTGELARCYRLSPARVSQLRRQLEHSWRTFIDELPTLRQQAPLPAA